jgi:hypothetical protein
MSDVERRQTRQRAAMVGVCVAVFAFGGPLIGQRFEVQKLEEAYRADAVELAQTLSPSRAGDVKLVSFTNKADAGAVLQTVSYALEQASELGLKAIPLRERDSRVLSGLATFTAENLGVAEHEKSEIDCLAEAVYYEARSESARGQMAVAEVVMNRVRNPHFPKTVCGVVFQGQYRNTGCQFTFTCDGSKRHAPTGEAWDRARAVALHVAMGLNKPVTNKATHYHTDYVNPYWKAGMVETAEIGTHIFYRFPKTTKEWNTAKVALAAQEQNNAAANEQTAALVTVEAEAKPESNADSLAAAALVKISADPSAIPAIVPASAAPDARAL